MAVYHIDYNLTPVLVSAMCTCFLSNLLFLVSREWAGLGLGLEGGGLGLSLGLGTAGLGLGLGPEGAGLGLGLGLEGASLALGLVTSGLGPEWVLSKKASLSRGLSWSHERHCLLSLTCAAFYLFQEKLKMWNEQGMLRWFMIVCMLYASWYFVEVVAVFIERLKFERCYTLLWITVCTTRNNVA